MGDTPVKGYELNFRLRCKNDGVMVSSALFKNSRAYHNTIIFADSTRLITSWDRGNGANEFEDARRRERLLGDLHIKRIRDRVDNGGWRGQRPPLPRPPARYSGGEMAAPPHTLARTELEPPQRKTAREG